MAAGVDFGVLGKDEKDRGHEARRFGEEMLFQTLKEDNSEAIAASGVKRIITAEPDIFSTLRKDCQGLPQMEYITQTIGREPWPRAACASRTQQSWS
jgi:Fe-S oxidoreductase